ncbi:MAG: putative Na+-dependent transporter [Cyclobacteriaceae bacterium]|jgi:predicted Na+-dependent transporter
MMNAKYHYRRWLIQAPIALTIIGLGACLIAEAAMLKAAQSPTLSWVGYGTIALIVFNSGISLFGDAILHRVRYERKSE